MSGHSHWANIKGKKEAADQQKGKVFSKVSREIILAINQGNGNIDPAQNIQLRSAIDKAKAVNMPKENIQRLIDRIKLRAELVQEVIYEAILDQGVTIMIKTATDNPNRTHGELASFLEKQGGHLVQKGAVAYQYDYCGRFEFTHSTESDVLSFSDSVGALDIEQIDNNYLVYVPYPNLSSALTEAEKIGFDKALELVYRPKMTIELENEKTDRLVNLLSSLEDFDDVSDLYTNVLFK